MLPVSVPDTAKLGSSIGKVEVTTGVQTVPAVRTRRRFKIESPVAILVPVLVNVYVQTRALLGPDSDVSFAVTFGISRNTAETVVGAVKVTVVEALLVLATLPFQPKNSYPGAGIAVMETGVPAFKKVPEAIDTVPPAAGETAVVNWYCVVKLAV